MLQAVGTLWAGQGRRGPGGGVGKEGVGDTCGHAWWVTVFCGGGGAAGEMCGTGRHMRAASGTTRYKHHLLVHRGTDAFCPHTSNNSHMAMAGRPGRTIATLDVMQTGACVHGLHDSPPPPVPTTYPFGLPMFIWRPHRSSLSSWMAASQSSRVRNSTNAKRPAARAGRHRKEQEGRGRREVQQASRGARHPRGGRQSSKRVAGTTCAD